MGTTYVQYLQSLGIMGGASEKSAVSNTLVECGRPRHLKHNKGIAITFWMYSQAYDVVGLNLQQNALV